MRVVNAKTKFGKCRLYTDAPDEKLDGYNQVGELEHGLKKQGYNARILKRYWFSERQLNTKPLIWSNPDGSHEIVRVKVHYIHGRAYTMIGDECNFDDAVLVHDDENDLCKTFYVLHDGTHYLYNDPILMESHGVATYTEYLGEAMQFESLCQALDFNQGLGLSVLKVEITVAYTPDLFTENLPECTDIQNTTNKG